VERFKTRHHKYLIPNAEVLKRLPEAVSSMAEPMVGQDAVAFYLLGERVADEVKVVLSGQGADEVFGGYFWYPRMDEASGSPSTVSASTISTATMPNTWKPSPRLACAGCHRRTGGAGTHQAQGRHISRPGAAFRRHHASRRRPGQARRQHDHGVGPGSARPLPRP